MFNLTIAEAEKVVYEGEAEILNVYTSNGQVGILKNHTPFIDTIKASELEFIDKDKKRHIMAVSGGWLFVWDDKVTVLVNATEFVSEIDIERALKQKEEAENLLKGNNLDNIQRVHATIMLEKAINRIRLANRNR